MKRTTILVLTLALLAGTAAAAPPTTDQLAQFHRTCVGISDNEPLCTCKRDAAEKLVDGEFMAVIIAAMQGTTPPSRYDVPYNDYIAQSNAICIPGY